MSWLNWNPEPDTNKYGYRTDAHGDEIVPLEPLEGATWVHWGGEDLAEKAAEHHYDEACGELWDPDHWPIEFEVFKNGESLGIFSVGMEYEPRFDADRAVPVEPPFPGDELRKLAGGGE